MPVEFCCVPVRCEGHFGNDSTLERRPAREKLRTVDHQRLFGGTERLFLLLRLDRLPRTVSQDPAPPVSRQQAGANARGIREVGRCGGGHGRPRSRAPDGDHCSTGIRVSEVQYITVEAAKNGKTEIALKGKIRTILLPSKLCRKLLKFAARQKPPPARSFAPKAASPCRDIKFGRK